MEVIEWVNFYGNLFHGKSFIFNVNSNKQTFPKSSRLKMQGRSTHLQEKCSFYGLDVHGNDTLHKPNPWEFLINKKHHLVWCNVFKAASTSWMYNFNLLAGYSPQFLKKSNVVPLTLARKKYPRPSVQEVNKNTSIFQFSSSSCLIIWSSKCIVLFYLQHFFTISLFPSAMNIQ